MTESSGDGGEEVGRRWEMIRLKVKERAKQMRIHSLHHLASFASSPTFLLCEFPLNCVSSSMLLDVFSIQDQSSCKRKEQILSGFSSSCEVPQGSVLDPLLFPFYINSHRAHHL